MTFERKILPEYYHAVASGVKTFEIRKEAPGAPFEVGADLLLRAWDGDYLPLPHLRRRITYILRGEELGIKSGYAILGLRRSR
jgi:hypothetical protein